MVSPTPVGYGHPVVAIAVLMCVIKRRIWFGLVWFGLRRMCFIEPGMVRWEECLSGPTLRYPFSLRYQQYHRYSIE